jgi:hypothetical protein
MRARWLRSLVREHRDSIPEARGGRPAVAHPPPSMCLPRATPFEGTVVTVAPMAKDAVSKRLAEEIALAKRITDRIKNPPSLSLLDLATPDQKEELAASLWLHEKGPFTGPVIRAFKAFGLDHRNNGDWYNRRPTWRASFSLNADPVRGRNGPPSGCTCSSRRLLHTSASAPRLLTRISVAGCTRKAMRTKPWKHYGAHCRTRVIPSAIASLLSWPTLWRERRRETGPEPLMKPPLLKA